MILEIIVAAFWPGMKQERETPRRSKAGRRCFGLNWTAKKAGRGLKEMCSTLATDGSNAGIRRCLSENVPQRNRAGMSLIGLEMDLVNG